MSKAWHTRGVVNSNVGFYEQKHVSFTEVTMSQVGVTLDIHHGMRPSKRVIKSALEHYENLLLKAHVRQHLIRC